ncbi:MAG TPA: succinate dehydrogenase, hydrophobic membrane anchor protein [Rhizomicrobium sp.]
MKQETPLHRVQGLGAAHSGTGHFWHQRMTAVALVLLGGWFAVVMLGLVGASEASLVGFLARPWNAILMAAFVIVLLYHMMLGLQVVIDDYAHAPGAKIFLMLLMRAFAIAIGAASLFALIHIAAL